MSESQKDILNTIVVNYRLYTSTGKKQKPHEIMKKINDSLQNKGFHPKTVVNIKDFLRTHIILASFQVSNEPDFYACFIDDNGNPLFTF